MTRDQLVARMVRAYQSSPHSGSDSYSLSGVMSDVLTAICPDIDPVRTAAIRVVECYFSDSVSLHNAVQDLSDALETHPTVTGVDDTITALQDQIKRLESELEQHRLSN